MGKVLFKLFGFDISILKLVIGMGAAAIIYLAFDSVRDHFQHIKDLETENEGLKTKVTVVEGQRDSAIETNRLNQEIDELEEEVDDSNREIADLERKSAKERAKTYEEIRNAINSTPVTSEPVAPIIDDTLDRLWGDSGTTGSEDSNEE